MDWSDEMRPAPRPLNAQVIEEEIRFLLKTLTRDDLFGESVSLTEAEKLLESSLSVPFVEYCGVLPRLSVVSIDRVRNVIAVTQRGREIARGANDPDFFATLIAHFAPRFESPRARAIPAPQKPTHVGPPPAPVRTDPRQEVRPEPRVEARPTKKVETRASDARADGGFARPPLTVVLDERFKRGERIGEGTMGTVYRAHDTVLGRDVVEKAFDHVFAFVSYIPHDDLALRLKNAALAIARLDHPSINPILDIVFDENPPSVVSSLATGGSLAMRLAQKKASSGTSALPVEQALSIFIQSAHALAYAHAHGVVHGGLKPENVLFDGRGNVRLSDFGFARVTEKPMGSTVPVYMGTGATSYMAPEQLHKGEMSPAGDVHALGILFYEMVTGELPGRRSPMPSTVTASLDKALDDIFDRMTRDRPEDRFESADELLAEVAARVPALADGARMLMLFEKDPFAPPVQRPTEALESTSVIRAADDEQEVKSVDAEPITTAEYQL
jgi:hypothetical protein